MAARQTEVRQLDDVGGAEQEILRFDVAVHDGLVCRRRDTRSRLLNAIHRAAEGERAMREDGMLEVMPVDVIHHDEEAAAILAEVDGAHDMRAGEAGQQLELTLEALDQLAFGGGLPAQHLDGIVAMLPLPRSSMSL